MDKLEKKAAKAEKKLRQRLEVLERNHAHCSEANKIRAKLDVIDVARFLKKERLAEEILARNARIVEGRRREEVLANESNPAFRDSRRRRQARNDKRA